MQSANISAPQPYLQDNFHVVRVAFAFLVAPELGAAVQQRGDNTGLLGVYRRRRDKRGRGCGGRGGGVAGISSGDRHGSRFAGRTPNAGDSCLRAELGRRPQRVRGGQVWRTTIQSPPRILYDLIYWSTSAQKVCGLRRGDVDRKVRPFHWFGDSTFPRFSKLIGCSCGRLYGSARM